MTRLGLAAASWLVASLVATLSAQAQVAIRGETVHTMAGEPLRDGVVVMQDGRITAIGPAASTPIPQGFRTLSAKVVTPGLIDAHSTLGLSGILNYEHDQEQLEDSAPIQPALRALDAYNAHDPLIRWVRSFGVTTIHTGHAPGELISGQTMILKTVGNTVDQALLVPQRTVACTLSSSARKSGDKSPGTRGKMIAMLRAELIKAQEHSRSTAAAQEKPDSDPPARDLQLEALQQVLNGQQSLLVTADRAQDLASALRLAHEFNISVWLDSAAESYLLIDEIKAAGVPVIIHPTMARATDERENLSFETAAKLVEAGIPVALQSGYEAYVPKTRVVLFEAALAAAHGLPREKALGAITRDAATILGISERVGSLEVGKDGDVALFDGDPFEYTTHCVGVVVNGRIASSETR